MTGDWALAIVSLVAGAAGVSTHRPDPLRLIRLDQVMALGAGDPRIRIGVLDGPVVLEHRLLAALVVQVRPGSCAVPRSAVCAHGTLVAGVLGARRDSGAAGIAPGCPLLIRPVLGEDGAPAGPAGLACGIADCVAAGARVINVSAAFTGAAPAAAAELTGALDHAANRGVLVVAAAGNEARVGGSPLISHPWVVPVTSCDGRGFPLAAANLGRSIARRGLRAPGAGIWGLAPAGGRGPLGGTSAAAALVTGAIALAWSAAPQAGAAAVRDAVNRQGKRTGVVPPLLDAVTLMESVTSAYQEMG